MDYRTVTTILTDEQICDAALRASCQLTSDNNAHLDALCIGLDHSQQGFYYTGASAMMLQDNLTLARDHAVGLEDKTRQILGRQSFPWSIASVSAQMVALNGLVANRTRFSDLVVLPKPYGEGRGHEYEAITEAALFDGNVPVLILPDAYTLPKSIDTVVIAWNQSNEALRAARRALPFLKQAKTVSIAIIDPPQHSPERSDPGGALSQMLARHGVRTEVSVLAKTMPRVSDVLKRHMNDTAADMLVMGAYGHSRFRESIMGGATRHMLEEVEHPILMAH